MGRWKRRAYARRVASRSKRRAAKKGRGSPLLTCADKEAQRASQQRQRSKAQLEALRAKVRGLEEHVEALKSELALRNAEPSPDSVEGFLRASHVHNHSASHTLRGAGVDNVEELALLDEAELEGVGLSPPERRILARALRKYAEDAPEAADAAEEEGAEDEEAE